MKSRKGFTLFELTLSLAIISVIAVGVMTITVTTINGTYMRNIKYLCKNEYQNLATCFACSDFSDEGGNFTTENLEANLKFYFTVDCTYADSIREKNSRSPVTHCVPTASNPEANKYVIKIGYDSLFNPCEYNEDCPFSIFMNIEVKDGKANLTMKVNSKKGLNLGMNPTVPNPPPLISKEV